MTATATLLDDLAALVRDHYVFPDVAHDIADALRAASPDPTPASISRALQSVNNDLHLRVRERRATQASGVSDWTARYAGEAVQNAGGVKAVSRLDARTGLLGIAPYMSPVQMAEPYLAAAFSLLAGVDRLVIDLRDGRGGTPETVAFICGHLLGEEPVHLQDIAERTGVVRQYWTSPAAGRLPDSTRIAVLTAEGTFSGCEELAYDLQALGRARVFGRTTGGGAHPVEVFPLSDELEATIPVARSINAVTGTNWEQVGVVPDLDCDPVDALDTALRWFDEDA